MRISDWSSDVCSSDLHAIGGGAGLLLYLQIFLEIAERLDTVARALDLEAVERIPFGKAELAPDHLVLGASVAVDVHPLHIDARRFGHLEGDLHRQVVLEIGRASCRAVVGQYVSYAVVAL